jgi:large subunit ribosomal protein L37Ae
MTTKKVKSTGRFGARYGIKLRKRVREIEEEQKKKHMCPYCGKTGGVGRLSPGIWNCKKCGSKFTSKAYTVAENEI